MQIQVRVQIKIVRERSSEAPIPRFYPPIGVDDDQRETQVGRCAKTKQKT
jgi:hypothetical protein